MTQNTTELMFVIDRSGSMSGLEKDTVGGFNSVIKKQKKGEGEVIVSTLLFNDTFITLHDRVPLSEVHKMTEEDYFASGSTAMLDAVGHLLTQTESVHAAMKEGERPSKTICVIITDGQENSSTRYDYNTIKRMIESQKERGWEFMFLGANIDVAKEARRMGMSLSDAAEFKCDEVGLKACYDMACDTISHIRCRRDSE